ncbi:hypothetical protein J2Y68_003586 [Paenarthrobacter nitroguajacolicus]|nr:hypothetical protein [Paenarthrobacter nitroguajacolicus]
MARAKIIMWAYAFMMKAAGIRRGFHRGLPVV